MNEVICKKIRTELQALCDEMVGFPCFKNGFYVQRKSKETGMVVYEEYVETDLDPRMFGWDEEYDPEKGERERRFLLVEYKDARSYDHDTLDRVLLEVKVVFCRKTEVLQCTAVDTVFVDTLLADVVVEFAAVLAQHLNVPFRCMHYCLRQRRLK